MKRMISIGGTPSCVDISSYSTEAYPDGEMFVSIDIGFHELLYGGPGFSKQEWSEDDKEGFSEFLWDALQQDELRDLIINTIKEFQDEATT